MTEVVKDRSRRGGAVREKSGCIFAASFREDAALQLAREVARPRRNSQDEESANKPD